MATYEYVDFSELAGYTFTAIEVGDNTISFITDGGTRFECGHSQNCCEHVYIESIVGSVDDLIGHPILLAESVTSHEMPPHVDPEFEPEAFLWTFYKLATIKGYVDIRWLGTSNGYYGMGVDTWMISQTEDEQ